MSRTELKQCCRTVYGQRGLISWPCTRRAIVTVGGKHYCRVHSPEETATRRAKADAKCDSRTHMAMAPYAEIARLKRELRRLKRTISEMQKLIDQLQS